MLKISKKAVQLLGIKCHTITSTIDVSNENWDSIMFRLTHLDSVPLPLFGQQAPFIIYFTVLASSFLLLCNRDMAKWQFVSKMQSQNHWIFKFSSFGKYFFIVQNEAKIKFMRTWKKTILFSKSTVCMYIYK